MNADARPPSVSSTTQSDSKPGSRQWRRSHEAAFEATLMEIFLPYRLQLGEPLGTPGKEATVYAGVFHGIDVAVKIFNLSAEDLRDAVSSFGAFKVECEKTMILSRRSTAIVQVLEYGDAEMPADLPEELRGFFPLGLVPFMITERAPYGSLDRLLRTRRSYRRFDRISLLECVATATDGIKEAHDHQVAHRDIKPQNILIFSPGQGKIADFGIARWRSRRSRRETAMLTPKYSSPEQAFYALTGQREEQVDLASDVYSWATMVYEVVTGMHPFAWAVRSARDPVQQQRNILKAIAGNDRRGFAPTGDITFDSLIHDCTAPLRQRVCDIAIANNVLRQLIIRLKASQ